MPNIATILTVRDYLSENGVNSFADNQHDAYEDDDVVDACVAFGNAYVIGKLCQRYTVAAMESATILIEIATVIACRRLCLRRGNPVPQSLEATYQEFIEKDGLLDQLAAGLIPLIADDGSRVPQVTGYAPNFANLTVDRRYRGNRIRVEQSSSSAESRRLRRDVDYYTGYGSW